MNDILTQPEIYENRTLWVPLGGNNGDTIGGNAHILVDEWVDASGDGHRSAIAIDSGNLFGRGGKYSEFLPVFDPFLAIPAASDGKTAAKPAETPLEAVFLTHAHEDHIAALKHYINRGFALPPIYCSALTAQYIRDSLEEVITHPGQWPRIRVMAPGERVNLGRFTVRAAPASHSISQAFAFQVKTETATATFTGDFKIDQSVLLGPKTDLSMFAEIGAEGLDALMMDSTRAAVPGFTMEEAEVRAAFSRLMDRNPDKRFVISVMGRNTERIAGIVKVSAEHGRRIIHEGPALKKTLYACSRAGIDLRSLAANVAIHDGKSQQALHLAPEESTQMVTGTQGEIYAALALAERGDHRRLKLDPARDIIIVSASLIPGNEAEVSGLIGRLRAKGFHVIVAKDDDVASSGHPAMEDCKLVATTMKPRIVIPVHGSVEHRQAQCRNMAEIGVPSLMVENGDIVHLGGPEGARIVGYRPHKLIGVVEKRLPYGNTKKDEPKVVYAYETLVQPRREKPQTESAPAQKPDVKPVRRRMPAPDPELAPRR